MKFHLLWALLALTLLVATSYAQPPACVGDQCAVATSHVANSTATGPIRSIVVKRTLLPHQPARTLAGVAVRGTSKILRGSARATLKTGKAIVGFSRRVAEVALPPYPRVRQRLACAFRK